MVKNSQKAPIPCTRLHHDRSGVTPRKSEKANRTQEILEMIRNSEDRDDGDHNSERIKPCDESEDDQSFPAPMPSHSGSGTYSEDGSSVGSNDNQHFMEKSDSNEGGYSDVADSRDEEERDLEEETDEYSFTDAKLEGLRYEPCDRTPEPGAYGFTFSSEDESNLIEIASDYIASEGADGAGSVNSGSNSGKSEDSGSLWGPIPEIDTVENESVQHYNMRAISDSEDGTTQDEEEEEAADTEHDLGKEAQIENVTKVTWKPNKKGLFSFLKRSISSKSKSSDRKKSLRSNPAGGEVISESELISVEDPSESGKDEASEYDADNEDSRERSDAPKECSKDILKEKFSDGSSRSSDESERSAEHSEDSGDSTEASEESVNDAAPDFDSSLAGTFASFLGISSLEGWTNGFGTMAQSAEKPEKTDAEEMSSTADEELSAVKNEDLATPPLEEKAEPVEEAVVPVEEIAAEPVEEAVIPVEEIAAEPVEEAAIPVQEDISSGLEIEATVENGLETDDKAGNDMAPEEENTEEKAEFAFSETHVVEEAEPEEEEGCQEPSEVLPVSTEVVEKKQGGKPAILPIAVVGPEAAAAIAGHCKRKKTKRFKSFFRKDRKNDRSPKKGRGKTSARKGKAGVTKEEALERQPVEEVKAQSTTVPISTVPENDSPAEVVVEDKALSTSKRGSIFKKLRGVGSYRKGKSSSSKNEASMPTDGGEAAATRDVLDVPISPSKRRGLLSRFKSLSQRKLKKEAEARPETEDVEPEAPAVVEDVFLTVEAGEAEEAGEEKEAGEEDAVMADREEKPSSFANLVESLTALSDWAPVIDMPLSKVLSFGEEEKVDEKGQTIDAGTMEMPKEEEGARELESANTEEEQMATPGTNSTSPTAFLSQLSNQIVNINIGVAAAQLGLSTNNCLQPQCDYTVAGAPTTTDDNAQPEEETREVAVVPDEVDVAAAADVAVPEVEDSKDEERQGNDESKSPLKTDESVNEHSLLVIPPGAVKAEDKGDALPEGGQAIVADLGQTLMSDLLFFDPVKLVGTLREQVVSTPVTLPEDINLTEAAEKLHQKLFFTDLDEEKLRYTFSESKSFVPEEEEDAVDYLERKLFFTELGDDSE